MSKLNKTLAIAAFATATTFSAQSAKAQTLGTAPSASKIERSGIIIAKQIKMSKEAGGKQFFCGL